MSESQSVSIPAWLAKVLCATCGLVVSVMFAAMPWASSVASNISQIKTQIEGNSKLSEVEVAYLRERIAANESLARDHETRLREVEHVVGTKRTASRPIVEWPQAGQKSTN